MTDARVVITENTLVNDHMEYRVELQRGNGIRLSSISRRYREFTELHAQMLRFSQPFKVPHMPPKKFFGRTNPSFVKKRQHELQTFLDKLFSLMILHPNADTAWRLLCLFLAVDQSRLKIPEAIINRNITNGSGMSVGDSGYVDLHEGGIHDISATSEGGGVEFSGAGGGYRVGAGLKDPAVRTTEDIENERLDIVVNEFAKQTINVSRGFEERLRKANPNIIKKISIDDLAVSIKKHIYTAPLFNPPKCSLMPGPHDKSVPQGEVSDEQQQNQDKGNGEVTGAEANAENETGNEEPSLSISTKNVLIDMSVLAQHAKDLQSNLSTLTENKAIAAENLVYYLENTEASAKT